MRLKNKCRCASEAHGHTAGKCKGVATEPEELCEDCRDKTAEELSAVTEQDRPLAYISERE